MNYSTLQRRGFTFWEAVVVLGILGILAAVLFPTSCRSRENPRRSACQSNLKQIMLGVKQYVQDYDERFPLVASGRKAYSGKADKSGNFPAFGWADAIQPYSKSTQILQCWSEQSSATKNEATQPQYTDYWFNARLSGVQEAKLDIISATIGLGDGNDGTDSTNARYHLWLIPEKWRSDFKSPLYRHLDGANFAFADGHAKWLKADKWMNGLDVSNSKFTLRLKPTN